MNTCDAAGQSPLKSSRRGAGVEGHHTGHSPRLGSPGTHRLPSHRSGRRGISRSSFSRIRSRRRDKTLRRDERRRRRRQRLAPRGRPVPPALGANLVGEETKPSDRGPESVPRFHHRPRAHLPNFRIEEACDLVSTDGRRRRFVARAALESELAPGMKDAAGGRVDETRNSSRD